MMAVICISVAAICKAIADTLQHHYYESVFKNFNEKFWNPAVSYKYAKFLPFTKYRLDAWHLANSIMIVSFVLACITDNLKWHWLIQLVLFGIIYIVVFNLFYNKILKK